MVLAQRHVFPRSRAAKFPFWYQEVPPKRETPGRNWNGGSAARTAAVPCRERSSGGLSGRPPRGSRPGLWRTKMPSDKQDEGTRRPAPPTGKTKRRPKSVHVRNSD
jgi:hypothetical protein